MRKTINAVLYYLSRYIVKQYICVAINTTTSERYDEFDYVTLAIFVHRE